VPVHDVLERVACLLLDPNLERVVLVPGARSPVTQDLELSDDADAVETGLFVQLAQKPLLETLARVEPPRRHLRPGLRVAALVEDEQLGAAVTLPRHVRKNALPHYVCARSFALYSRFAAW